MKNTMEEPGSWVCRGFAREAYPRIERKRNVRVWFRRPGSGISWIDPDTHVRQSPLQSPSRLRSRVQSMFSEKRKKTMKNRLPSITVLICSGGESVRVSEKETEREIPLKSGGRANDKWTGLVRFNEHSFLPQLKFAKSLNFYFFL